MESDILNPGGRIRVSKDACQILRETLRGVTQPNPGTSLEAAQRMRKDSNYHSCITYSMRCCSKVFMAFVVTVSFVYVILSLQTTASVWRNSLSTNLMITPYLNEGNITEARLLSRVDLFPGVTSYSGFLTVDDTCKSHLFFWFFPAASGNKSAPLILWHGGGPGTSALFGLFQGTGPITLSRDAKSWTHNPYSWTTERSILYLDSPVGAGFSYTEYDEGRCYSSSSDDVAVGTINALRQFYQLFPEHQNNDLYISTSSYGGKFAPSIAWRMHNDNQLDEMNGKAASINLKGFISMSGFSDPLHQVDYGEFYFNLGFIDSLQLKYFQAQEAIGKSNIRTRHYYQAYEVIDPLIVGNGDAPSYLKNVTGINHPYNYQVDLKQPDIEDILYRHDIFLNQKWVQDAIHVDRAMTGKRFSTSSDVVYLNLLRDLYKSVSPLVEELLDSGKYKLLFTAGQLDLIVPHTTISRFLEELKWGGEGDFMSTVTSPFSLVPSVPWNLNDQVVGYRKTVGNLTYLLLRDTGHHPFIDQPETTLNMMLQFTGGSSSGTLWNKK